MPSSSSTRATWTGWSTTEPDGQIELWHTGYLDVPAAEGQQFAELSANEPGELYQERATVPGTPLTYVVSHRGRSGVDTMAINIGPPGGPPTLSRNVSTGNTDWQQVFGRYVVPAGQTVTRFGFAAVQNASGNPSIGNFLDGIVFSAARCSVTVTKRLAPASARGRFDLLVGDEVVAAGAGNGDTSAPVAVPLDTVRISEQAASGTDPDRYASAIRCVDAATGASVAQAFGRETTVRFDRPRDVACVVANVVPPAILVEKVMAPDDAGRFDLRVNGRVVAEDAGDHTIAGPVRVASRRVTVSERAVPGTDQDDYDAAIECRSRAGSGPVVAAARAPSVTFDTPPRSVVRCVLLNLAKRQPSPPSPPSPSPPAQPPVSPAAAKGELDLVLRTRALAPVIAPGGRARFRIRVTNRGPLPATHVRIVPHLRQAARARAPSGSRSREAVVNAPRRRAAACATPKRSPPARMPRSRSRSTARATSRAPLRLVAAAHAVEPETVVMNNLDRARVRIVRLAACPAAAARPRAAAC